MAKLLKLFLLVPLVLINLTACNNENTDLKWYPTKEEAIVNGLKEDGIDRPAVLSVEEVEGETIVFYEAWDAFGKASIAESKEGYGWYRSSVYSGFEGTDVPYMVIGTRFNTYEGQEISLIVGKVYDSNIKKIILSGDGPERELKIIGDSQLFYSIHKEPFEKLRITPVN